MTPADWLYLFSSNASPQYAQDILNVLAGAPGQRYMFRYEERWVHPDTRAAWDQIGRDKNRILVCFSLQQRAFFQAPAFIPIRMATVVETQSVGSRYFVTFTLDEYVSLPKPPATAEREVADAVAVDQAYAAQVRAFTDVVRQRATTPYDASASLGQPIPRGAPGTPEVDFSSDQAVLFERATEYLWRAESFADARFVRFEAMRLRGSDQPPIEITGTEPAFELEAGKIYELQLLQSQPYTITDTTRFSVSADGTVVSIVGDSGFDISSSYDQINIQLLAVKPATFGTNSTIIVIEPPAGGGGPRIELPCRVVSSAKEAAGVTGITTLALAFIGAQTVLPLSTGLKVLFVIIGAFVAAYMQMFGWNLPSPVSF